MSATEPNDLNPAARAHCAVGGGSALREIHFKDNVIARLIEEQEVLIRQRDNWQNAYGNLRCYIADAIEALDALYLSVEDDPETRAKVDAIATNLRLARYDNSPAKPNV